MSHIRTLIFFVISTSLIACGGGSGGGSGSSGGSGSGGTTTPSIDSQIRTRLNNISEESITGFQELGRLVIDNSYTGINTEASVTESSFPTYSQFLLEQEEGAFASSGAVQAKPSLSAVSGLQALSKIDVSGTENCESGSLTLNGEVADNGVGAVQTTYDDCTLEGVTLNGDGALYIQDAEFTSFYVLYRNFEIRIGNEVDTLNGLMWFDQNEVVFDISGRSSDGKHYKVRDWTYRITNSGFGLEFVSGRVYLADEGYLEIEKYGEDSYRFDGADNAAGYLFGKEEYWLAAIDIDQNQSLDYLGAILKSDAANEGISSMTFSLIEEFAVPEYMSVNDSVLEIGDGNGVAIDLQDFLVYDPTISNGISLISGDSTISLYWSPVEGASSYRVYFAEESFEKTLSGYLNLQGAGSVPVTEPEASLVGLTNGQAYYFIITSTIEGEEGTPSEEVSAVPEGINVSGDVIYGFINDLDESSAVHTWGAEGDLLCTAWGVAAFDNSGYIYADDGITRVSDLYVLTGPADPLEITNAENFEYETLNSSIVFDEGDTVFFRGINNFYGAWHITDIAGGSEAPTLTGIWYFVTTEGSGDFSGALQLSNGSFQTSSFSNCPEPETP